MKKIGIALFALSMPMVVFAQLEDVENIVDTVQDIVNVIIPIAFALIVIAFFWGLAKYVMAAGDEGKKAEGRNMMIGGVLALFVAAAIWGIVAFIGDQLNIEGDTDVSGFGGPTTQIE